jgi:outer membrane lipoprotein-sorting protein
MMEPRKPEPDGQRPADARAADADLDADLLAIARRLERDLTPPPPSEAFVAQLGQRLDRVARERAAAPARSGGARGLVLPWPGRPRLLVGLATAAALVVAILTLPALVDRTRPVSATEIVQRAGAAAQGTQAYRSFIVHEVSEVQPAAIAGGADVVRSEITRWYQSPGHWRREVDSAVVAPDGQVLSRGGLVSVSDGATVWIHRMRDNVVIARRLAEALGGDELGPFPEVTGGLSGLLAQAGACYSPRLIGSDTIAERETYVIDLGRSRCVAPDNGSELTEWTIWVDKETFLILKSVQDIDGAAFATTTVTRIEYNARINPDTFRFAPPVDARLRDLR